MGQSEVDLRINETLQPGAVRRPPLPFCRLVGTVCNSAMQCGWKPHLPGWVEFGAVMNPHLPGTCRPTT